MCSKGESPIILAAMRWNVGPSISRLAVAIINLRKPKCITPSTDGNHSRG